MQKKSTRIKSAVISGLLAVSAVASPMFTSTVTQEPSLTATAADSDNYARLLQYSLYFYDANMCGDKVGTSSAMEWRGNCHADDEVPGGFHDAGDHAMFGLPQGYSAATLGWSYYEFKDAYDASGQGEHLKAITDYFCDFFKRSTKLSGDTVTNFLYQKGDGDVDHGYWGAPEKQDPGRKMFWTSSTGADIAAEYAAALAVNYINFGNAEDLKYAEALYNFSLQTNSVAKDGPTGFYNNSSCVDEQGWAAGWLYLATKNEKYKNDCASKQTQYLGWVHGWENVNLGSAILLAEITGDWSKVKSYIGGQANGSNYLCLDDWGSARLNCSMQLCALVATKHGAADYSSWCKGQMNYLLGDNPFNTCFVTGYASNSAKNVHHRAASGYQGYNPPDGMNEYTTTYHPTNSHVLIGALTGGPNKNGQYTDVMNDYMCNEVAIDYNACLVGAAAGLASVYKSSGPVDTSITGVKKIYSGGITPGPDPGTSATTTTTTKGSDTVVTTTTTTGPNPSNNDKVLTPADMTVGTEKGDDGEMNNYAEFSPQGAKSATLYFKVNSNDMNASGAFGTWNGEWMQEDFENVKVPADKIVTVDYVIPANVGSTVKAMIFWPHGDAVTIEKVVLHMEGGSTTPPTTTSTSKTTTTTSTTSKPTTTTTSTTSQPPTTTSTSTTTPPDDKPPVSLYGDADCSGVVRMNDVVLIMQVISNADKYGENGSDPTHIKPQGISNADCYQPGSGITPQDALAIQQMLLGGATLPVQ